MLFKTFIWFLLHCVQCTVHIEDAVEQLTLELIIHSFIYRAVQKYSNQFDSTTITLLVLSLTLTNSSLACVVVLVSWLF